MPIYEYECADCGAKFELLIRGKEKPECPHCKGHRLDKLISASATHAKSSDSCGCAAKQAGMCHETGCHGGCCRG